MRLPVNATSPSRRYSCLPSVSFQAMTQSACLTTVVLMRRLEAGVDRKCYVASIGSSSQSRSRETPMNSSTFHMIAGAPTPVAPFSHAVETDSWLFVTGQMPTWPEDDSKPLPDGIEGQSRRVMDNLILVLRGAGY